MELNDNSDVCRCKEGGRYVLGYLLLVCTIQLLPNLKFVFVYHARCNAGEMTLVLSTSGSVKIRDLPMRPHHRSDGMEVCSFELPVNDNRRTRRRRPIHYQFLLEPGILTHFERSILQ